MTLTVTTLCVLAAFLATIAAAGKAPLWVGVLLAVLALALMVLPR